ncbi:MAG: orotate phosphoribosyltransferase [Oscillospiraceae bacterium]|jgi:orotate phosphoribosyltransferase|nr:orotate phosphoribosyltransferase [Oscillospiraceae bacterium]
MSDKRVLYPTFLDFMVRSGALLFGDFTLKSGRKSPYFINTGEYKTGAQLSRLGAFYAKLIDNSVRPESAWGGVGEALPEPERNALDNAIRAKFTVLYGPAYKGIPLAAATAAWLASHGLDLNVSFNRKEPKEHGEGGEILGYRPRDGDKIAIIEDVTTAGTSVRETLALLERLGIGASVAALYISVDRMERGKDDMSATAQLAREFGIEVHSIATAADIIDYLQNPPEGGVPIPQAQEHAANIRKYLDEYGAAQ